MQPKHIVLFGVMIVVACTLTGLVTYRLALRQVSRAPGQAVGSFPQQAGAMSGCVDFHDASSHLGESGCVSGRLLRVYTSRGGSSFLDFCQDYRGCPFTSVIFASDKTKFGDLSTLAGRQVEIHGAISSYQGRAEIIVRGPEQIHVAE